jgi:hypothetical protein
MVLTCCQKSCCRFIHTVSGNLQAADVAMQKVAAATRSKQCSPLMPTVSHDKAATSQAGTAPTAAAAAGVPAMEATEARMPTASDDMTCMKPVTSFLLPLAPSFFRS